MMRKKVICAATALLFLITPAFGLDLTTTTIGAGIINLVRDVTMFLTVLCPAVAGCFGLYFAMRRSGCEKEDAKMWEDRIKVAIICGVAGMLISGVITLIASYFV